MLEVSSRVSELEDQRLADQRLADQRLADQRLADLAKSLAHPARIRILRLLLATPGCIGGDIVDAVGLAQSTVSEHLRILKASGVISGEISGPRVCYALNPEALSPLTAFIALIKAPTKDACCIPDPEAAA